MAALMDASLVCQTSHNILYNGALDRRYNASESHELRSVVSPPASTPARSIRSSDVTITRNLHQRLGKFFTGPVFPPKCAPR
jgi:hypothetical protein